MTEHTPPTKSNSRWRNIPSCLEVCNEFGCSEPAGEASILIVKGTPLEEQCVVHSELVAHFHPLHHNAEDKILPGNIGIDTSVCPGKCTWFIPTQQTTNSTWNWQKRTLFSFFDIWNITFPENQSFYPLFYYPEWGISVNGVAFFGSFEELELEDAQVIEVVYWNNQTDRDGDGFSDENDAFPEDSNEWNDTDGDGVGDNEDAFLRIQTNGTIRTATVLATTATPSLRMATRHMTMTTMALATIQMRSHKTPKKQWTPMATVLAIMKIPSPKTQISELQTISVLR